MAGISRKTQVVSIRLPNEVCRLIEKRLARQGSCSKTISQYLRDRIIYDMTRIHRKYQAQTES